MATTYSVAMPLPLHRAALKFLLAQKGQEELCFALWYPSTGHQRTSALVARLVLPGSGDRALHGNASFAPKYFERAVAEAASAHAGLALLHSHLGPGWQGMSQDDVRAEGGHAAAVYGATGLPFVGLTLATDGVWSSRLWFRSAPRTYERHWCLSTRVIGERLDVTFMDQLLPPPSLGPALIRTVSAWGPEVQGRLARLRIGVVGLGSVGSIVAEALARMGVCHLLLLDFDRMETVNRDRVLHASRNAANCHEPKVLTLARALCESAASDEFIVDPYQWSVCEEEGYRTALDCDVLFSCVDRPWARAVLNFIAYAHLIPVIDGGIQIAVTPSGRLRRADWRAHIVGPERRCLECLGQYEPGLVQAEREGYLDDPSYIAGLPADHPVRRSENVFAFSLNTAGMEILQFLMMVVAPSNCPGPGPQVYHFVPGFLEPSLKLDSRLRACNGSCLYPGIVASGDRSGYVVTGRHVRAEQIRALGVSHDTN